MYNMARGMDRQFPFKKEDKMHNIAGGTSQRTTERSKER